MSGGTIQIADNGDEWPFVMSRVPYRPADEQDWRRSILSGIAVNGPRYRASHRTASSVSPVPASIANAGDT